MSDILNTDVAPFCHGQNHSGSVPITTVRESATIAPEASLVQLQSLLDSRKAGTARHGRVRGPDHHHRPPSRPGTLDEFTLGRTDRGISRFARHRGFGQKRRLEVLDGDQIMAVDNMFGPHPRVVQRSPGGFLHQPGSLPLRVGVAPRLRTALPVASGHLSLRLRQFSGAPPAMTEMRQIEDGIGGWRSSGYAPIDPDTAIAAPFGQQRFLGGASGPNPVRVPHHLIHSNILSKEMAMRQHTGHLRPVLSPVKDGVSEAHPR